MIRQSFTVFAFFVLLSFSLATPVSVRQDITGLEAEPAPTTDLTQDSPMMPNAEEMSTEVMEEEAAPSMAPMMNSMGSSEYSFYYNVGGGESGIFMADPEDWVIGETAAFEMPDAEIIADMNADVYKSHRYGLLGSTWGYDIPVTMSGVYDCTLMYAETYSEFFTDEPNRTMMVEVGGDDGEMQTATYDVMVELGGQEFTAYDRLFAGIQVQETLKIRQTPEIGDAFLSGIKCEYTGPLGM